MARIDESRPLFGSGTLPTLPADAPRLAGIVGRLPDNAVVLIRQAEGRARPVRRGDDAGNGWRLAALAADAALFTRGVERVRVPLSLYD